MRFYSWIAVLLLITARPSCAEVTRFEILERSPFAGGRSFGKVGPYERIVGRVHYRVTLRNEPGRIIDLDKVPGSDKSVSFSSDLFILAPKDPGKGNGQVLYDVNNRGRKLALRFFNDAVGNNDPQTWEDAGSGFLMKQGFTIVWNGWDGELLPGDKRMQLHAPVAGPVKGKPITGFVRYEICLAESAAQANVNRDHHGAYTPTKKGLKTATLSWRLRPFDRRIAIPRDQFRLTVRPTATKQQGQLPKVELELAGGFKPGYLYELIYEARDPIVHGLCFVSVRDLMLALKFGDGMNNPFKGQGKSSSPIKYCYGFGVSQSGRFLREFLYQGFNQDGQKRQAFDGLIPHVSGGGLGSFNIRFAQPTLFATEHERRDCPSDRFPFAYIRMIDPLAGIRDGLLRRAESDKAVPLIIHTQTSAEYWSRSGSLVHTDPLGRYDAPQHDSVRIFAFGGTQHAPGVYPPIKGIGQTLQNPGDYRPFLRALLLALHQWRLGKETPPPGIHPTIEAGTLVEYRQQATRFPSIPGVRYPDTIQSAALLDFGIRFRRLGIIDLVPPRRLQSYRPLVPKCGADGNELGCLLPPEVKVPVATYTGWNLRSAVPGPQNAHVGLRGSYIPFATTKKQRKKSNDPRPSLEERYGSAANYRRQLRAACRDYVKRRLLLADEVDGIVEKHVARYRAAMKK